MEISESFDADKSLNMINDSKNSLFFLYLATLIMRAAAYISIAVITSTKYLEIGVSNLTVGVIIAFYPLAEVLTVMFFGTLADQIGRKPILLFSHFISAVAVFCFALTNLVYALFLFTALFGIGAAAKVSSTLTMVSDSASSENRAQLMAIFDMVTLGGLAGGYVVGVFLINMYDVEPNHLFIGAGIIVFISAVLVLFFVNETRTVRTRNSSWFMLKSVFQDRSIQHLLPVYIPTICLYGLIITFSERLTERIDLSLGAPAFRVLALMGGTLFISMIINGRLSDRLEKRRPFITVGLICFGVLAILIVYYSETMEILWTRWHVVLFVSLGAGAFPPAILAYLSDISKKDTSGTTFGVYSVIFGSGMIIGPLSGGAMLDHYGLPGFMVMVAVFVLVAAVGSVFLPEHIS
ncbi:MAG: MFS transporter [Candidatus Heimdallarchaeota archaeon]